MAYDAPTTDTALAREIATERARDQVRWNDWRRSAEKRRFSDVPEPTMRSEAELQAAAQQNIARREAFAASPKGQLTEVLERLETIALGSLRVDLDRLRSALNRNDVQLSNERDHIEQLVMSIASQAQDLGGIAIRMWPAISDPEPTELSPNNLPGIGA